MLRGLGNSQKFDPKTSALQIRTDSPAGSGHLVGVGFLDAEVYSAGRLTLQFSVPMKYKLGSCMQKDQVLSNVPEETDKVWTIYRRSDRVQIDCNGEVVLDFSLATCTQAEKWVYDREIINVIFDGTDTASDTYRQTGNSNSRSKTGLNLIHYCFDFIARK